MEGVGGGDRGLVGKIKILPECLYKLPLRVDTTGSGLLKGEDLQMKIYAKILAQRALGPRMTTNQ